jgi:hypothetical protein
MSREYRITVHARTASGFDTIGEFIIGNSQQEASQLFKILKGSPDNLEEGVLLMELREINDSLLFDVQLIQCTLDQVADNCRLIVKNQFRLLNLKDP